jgi:hypothetical protein
MQTFQISVNDNDSVLFLQILRNLKMVQDVKELLAQGTLLNTDAVGKLLNISPTFVLKLIDRNEIPCLKIDQDCYISLDNALTYQTHMKTEQVRNLEILVEEAQKLNLGYAI